MAKTTVYVIAPDEGEALNVIFDATLSTYDQDEAMKVARKMGLEAFQVALTKVSKSR